MEGREIIIAFLLLPIVAAIVVGWAARHWYVAAAIVIGAIGCIFLLPVFGGTVRDFASFFTGAAVAGAALLPLLFWRPSTGVWTRILVALVFSFAAHATFLYLVTAVR